MKWIHNSIHYFPRQTFASCVDCALQLTIFNNADVHCYWTWTEHPIQFITHTHTHTDPTSFASFYFSPLCTPVLHLSIVHYPTTEWKNVIRLTLLMFSKNKKQKKCCCVCTDGEPWIPSRSLDITACMNDKSKMFWIYASTAQHTTRETHNIERAASSFQCVGEWVVCAAYTTCMCMCWGTKTKPALLCMCVRISLYKNRRSIQLFCCFVSKWTCVCVCVCLYDRKVWSCCEFCWDLSICA